MIDPIASGNMSVWYILRHSVTYPNTKCIYSLLILYNVVWFMVFNATFSNISVISWWSVLSVEETRVPGENHQPGSSHWQTLSHTVVYKVESSNNIICRQTLAVMNTDHSVKHMKIYTPTYLSSCLDISIVVVHGMHWSISQLTFLRYGVVRDGTLIMQSVSITSEVVLSNPAHGGV